MLEIEFDDNPAPTGGTDLGETVVRHRRVLDVERCAVQIDAASLTAVDYDVLRFRVPPVASMQTVADEENTRSRM